MILVRGTMDESKEDIVHRLDFRILKLDLRGLETPKE
jgi:hypothetical protein